MNQAHISQELARLKQALIEERHMLQAGQAQETPVLMPEKLGAMEELEKAFGSLDAEAVPALYRDDMVEIVQLARENAVHFEAIRHGMRRAIERLESLHASAYVGSYTQTGGKVAFTEVTGRFVKKA